MSEKAESRRLAKVAGKLWRFGSSQAWPAEARRLRLERERRQRASRAGAPFEKLEEGQQKELTFD